MYTGGAGAAAVVIANAIKSSGAIIVLEVRDFMSILAKTKDPLVVTAEGGLFKKKNRYITSYKGLFFYTQAEDVIKLPLGTELIKAKSISIPD
ncbi:MAG: hypothetical protein LR001_07225 [Clostridiales bacterium]|nr:hypothetical protein [Clostridiales bacterium]